MILIGVDTGGTFTDFVYRKGAEWRVYKCLSTPADPSAAVMEGVRRLAGDESKRVVHGSTVATNAILERKGARTALITNKGFEDVIEIGRQNRSRLYDLTYRREPCLVPPALRLGISGRTLQTGEEQAPLDMAQVTALGDRLKDSGVESVAVCLLFSFADPSHERAVARALEPLGLPVSLSHRILSEFREFERTSTTVINAYVTPKMSGYIGRLMNELAERDGLSVMQSNGGSISARTAMKESARTILSGPAGGAVGAFETGRTAGHDRLITFDMGGTSTDVSLMDGVLPLTMESRISGFPIKVPMIDIHTVGAGGGSIASMDRGGALRVGPQSAGADPGPICYGKGRQLTVTDANLYLGRLIPEHFLGGRMPLQPQRLGPYVDQMAGSVGLSGLELAEGILAVVNAAMERAIRVISVERGHDPREFALFCFGGAGGMHAAYLARMLGIPKVVIPPNPGILSAIGMLTADVIKDYSLTVMTGENETTADSLRAGFLDLEQRGREDLADEGILLKDQALERYLDMRYEGQSYEIIVPFEENPADRFHELHEKKYGYKNAGKSVQIVNLRLRARGIPEKPHMEILEQAGEEPPTEACLGERPVVFDQGRISTRIVDREKLLAGNRVGGPAILVEYSSTIVVPPFADVVVDEYGNGVMEIK